MGATEDAASGRAARPDGSATVSPDPPGPAVRRIAAWAGCWLVLFWAWLLYNGQWDESEVIAAACAGAIGTAAVAVVDRCAWRKLRFRTRHLRRIPQPLWEIFPQFAYVTWALWTRPRGRFVALEVGGRAGSDDPAGRAERVFVTYLDTLSANDYTVEIERERKLAVRHTLVRAHPSPLP
jgi:hypothetical protein